MIVGRRVLTRQISSGEGGRAAKENAVSGRPVSRRSGVERRDRPLHVHGNRVVADRDRRGNRSLSIRRLVEDRIGEPHYVPVIGVIVLDLEVGRLVSVEVVRIEMAVRDPVMVSRLVDVLRRQR